MADLTERDRLKKAAYEKPLHERQPQTWGDVMWSYIHRGYPREWAAYKADEWERKRKQGSNG